jgi:ParB/RepB/Spo0J family partition protein
MSRKKELPVLDFIAKPKNLITTTLISEGKDNLHKVQPIALSFLEANPYQPRLEINPETLAEFAEVIRQQGFQGVLIARPHPAKPGYYQITAGHRRKAAAELAGLTVLPVMVRELIDEEMAALAITENIQRDDLNPLEEGRIYQLMLNEMDYTQEQIAKEIGKNRGYVVNRLRVANAPADVQALIIAKPDSLRAVSTLIKEENEQKRTEAIKLLLENKLTTDDLPDFLFNSPAEPTEPGSAIAVNQLDKEVIAEVKSAQPTPESNPFDDTRIGKAKLLSALRSLKNYSLKFGEKTEYTDEEKLLILNLYETVKELREKAGIEPDNF